MRDTYNVNIGVLFCGQTSVSTTGSEMYKFIQKSVMSGDSEFDAIISSPYDSIGYAMTDLVLDLNTLEYLNLDKPWWDQNARRELVFGNRTYVVTGDLTVVNAKATQSIIFNKPLSEMYELDNHYDIVKSGKWTLDRFIENSKKVSSDLDGNDKLNENDRFGYISWQDDGSFFLYSTDNSYGIINSYGKPGLTLYSERSVNVWEKLISFIDSEAVFSMKFDTDVLKGKNNLEIIDYMFTGNHALYCWAPIGNVLNLRSSDADFGILPPPKYDENQENYVSPAGSYGNAMLTVPVTTSDPERTGYVLEAFAAKSSEIVKPAFYEKTLVGKSTRDDESVEMLDILFATKRYDIGNFFMWGNLTNKVMEAWNKKDPNFTSMYDGAKSAALEDVAKIEKLFE